MGIRRGDPTPAGRRAARRAPLVVALAVGLVVLVWVVLGSGRVAPDAAPPPPEQAVQVADQAVTPGTVLEPQPQPKPQPQSQSQPCVGPATEPFRPARITVPGVTRDATVLALPRDAHDVPSAPPISDTGKTEFAWSVPPDPMPGEPKGNVLLNAHTWPDGTALGNKLLDGLQVGGRIIVSGKSADGKPQSQCYQVTKRVVILASDGSSEYYQRNGPPQLALVVCSPPRLGPGNWLHRTIWYASPTVS